jgi:hypothetical protein
MRETELCTGRAAYATGEGRGTAETLTTGEAMSWSQLTRAAPSPFVVLRDDIFAVGVAMGELAAIVKESFPLDNDAVVVKKGPLFDSQKCSLSPLQAKLSEMWSLLVICSF